MFSEILCDMDTIHIKKGGHNVCPALQYFQILMYLRATLQAGRNRLC